MILINIAQYHLQSRFSILILLTLSLFLISFSHNQNIKRIEYQNSELIYKIKKEKKKEKEARNNKIIESKIYPNMIGKWRTYQTDYLKMCFACYKYN